MKTSLRSHWNRFASFCLLLGWFHISARAQDEHWAHTFGGPGTTNLVYALAVKGDDVYASGAWTAGQVSTNNWIEHWNGLRWSALPGVFTGSMPIMDSVFIGDDLYVCGLFSQLDGQTANGIARWNGQKWSVIGDIRGAALCLATDGSNLYVGGFFTNVSGVSATNVAKWNGASWSSLGDGLGTGANSLFDSFVRTLLWKDGTLYAGGLFTNSGAATVRNLGRWTGNGWVEQGGGTDGTVHALAAGPANALYAGGDFQNAGSSLVRGIACWDGANWLALGSGVISPPAAVPGAFRGVFAIGVLGTNVVAGGSFTNAGGLRATRIARWDGASWSVMGAMNDNVITIRVSGTNMYIGGAFTQKDGLIVNHLTRWDGANFYTLGKRARSEGTAFPGLRALAAGNGRIYAGGVFTGIGTIEASRIACWDGTNWSALGSGVKGVSEGSGTAINAVALASNGDVYVGGLFTNAGGISASNIARWNGSSWSALGAGIPGTVSAIAVRGSEVFVGGTFTMNTAGGTAFNLAKWNGSSWTSLPGGAFAGNLNNFTVSALAFQGSDLVVGGNFVAAPIGGLACSNVVKHNGTDWVALGRGVNSNVTALAVAGPDIYAGGRFTNASGMQVSRIAKWNGSSWEDVGGGVTGPSSSSVSALAVIGPDLYAGGNFTNAGGLIVNRIAKWNGSSWSSPGSGVTRSFGAASVLALAASGLDLFVGGNFEYAGGKPSYYIAQWNPTRNFDPSLRLVNPLRMPDGRFRVTVLATNVPDYVVEASADMTNWSPIHTNSVSGIQWEDGAAAGPPLRFYRAREQ